MVHVPVMTAEVLNYVLRKSSRVVLDATTGAGGHARSILDASRDVRVIAVDRDPDAISEARRTLAAFSNRVRFLSANFSHVDDYLDAGERVDGVLADLGVSSLQLDRAHRGFSYSHDGPLDMRMSADGRTAAAMLETTGVDELGVILAKYGDVTSPKRIARSICRAASEGRLTTTFDLRRAVEGAVGGSASPSLLSRVFQAVRIVLNEELDSLRLFLEHVLTHTTPNARIVVVSYHSGEDAIVKDFFRRESRDCICPPKQPICTCAHKARLRVLTRRAVKPDATEIARNPRARSARLRAAEVIAEEK